jgi:CheY-like chemotaxis protein
LLRHRRTANDYSRVTGPRRSIYMIRCGRIKVPSNIYILTRCGGSRPCIPIYVNSLSLLIIRAISLVSAQMPVILTVEDEVLVSEYLREALSDIGYDVIDTFNADEAIAVLEARDDIQIIITDINMPGSMDGLKLAAVVRDRWPPIKVIIATGRERPKSDEMPSGSMFVSKPYNRAALLSALVPLN